jgi:hypothetical protein
MFTINASTYIQHRSPLIIRLKYVKKDMFVAQVFLETLLQLNIRFPKVNLDHKHFNKVFLALLGSAKHRKYFFKSLIDYYLWTYQKGMYVFLSQICVQLSCPVHVHFSVQLHMFEKNCPEFDCDAAYRSHLPTSF